MDITITETITSAAVTGTAIDVTLTENTQTVTLSKTGLQGSSGVVDVTSPITNTGTAGSATIGINQTLISITGSQVTSAVGTATYATTAGSATNAGSADNSNYASTSGTSTFATNAGSATNAGTAVYSSTSGTAVFASSSSTSGTATYATTAGGAPPTGTAGGDLTGTYPNPTIGTGVITVTKTVAPVVNTSAGVGAVYFQTNTSALTAVSKVVTWVIQHNIGRYPLTIQVMNINGTPLAVTSYGYIAGKELTNTVTSIARSSGSTTATVSSVAHGLTAGDLISISGTAVSGIGGVWTVLNVISANQFTYTSGASTTANIASGIASCFSKLATHATIKFGTSTTTFNADTLRAVLIG